MSNNVNEDQNKARNKNQSEEQPTPSLSTRWMVVLAFLVGIIGGFGSLLFRAMIGFVHNISFGGVFNFVYNANQHPLKSVWGLGIIIVPVLGSFLVTWLTQTFAKEAKGHGVPEVMDAIYYRKGKIRPVVAIVKSIASAISIGTGGSVGREGPIIQIGASFGSLLGQVIKMSSRQRIVLIGAGAAAGIAATFNAPIGGLAFAMELMLVSLSAVNVVMVAIATVTATMISRIFLGLAPSFDVAALALPEHHALSPFIVSLFIPFGLLMGGAAALFILSIYWFEDRFDGMIKNPYARHALGMFILGLMFYVMMQLFGHYYIAGVGYATILDVLRNTLTNPWFLLMLFFCKLLATGLTLGSGASGGVFSPALFLGATLGAAFALFMQALFPHAGISPTLFTVAGMAAMVAGSTGAVLTGIAMTFEQTRDYADILPIMLSVALTYAVRVRITSESIYTLKSFRRGRMIPQGLQAAISGNKRARHIMSKSFSIVDHEELYSWLAKQSSKSFPHCTVISKGDDVMGVMQRELQYLGADVDPDKLISSDFIIVSANTSWPALLRMMDEKKAGVVLISRTLKSQKAKDIIGVVTQHELVASAHETAKMLD